MSNFVKYRTKPFDLGKDKTTKIWTTLRNSLIEKLGEKFDGRPYKHQGIGDVSTYKLFLEASFYLAKNTGRVGLIVPSGIYSDAGTKFLRNMLLFKSNWETLFGFHNMKKIFPIHLSFKFSILIFEKDKITSTIATRFLVSDLGEWEASKNSEMVQYSQENIKLFSPNFGTLLEIKDKNDFSLLLKMYKTGTPLAKKFEGEWKLDFSAGFHFTKSAKDGLFIPYLGIDNSKFSNDPDFFGFWNYSNKKW